STTVPVVFSIVGDPVELGLVTSFNRPGGNVTGVAIIPGTIVAKQFEALHEMVPTATVIGCLLNPNNPKTESDAREAQEAALACHRRWNAYGKLRGKGRRNGSPRSSTTSASTCSKRRSTNSKRTQRRAWIDWRGRIMRQTSSASSRTCMIGSSGERIG